MCMTSLSIIFSSDYDYVTLPRDFVKIENDSIVFHNGHILKYSKTFYMVLLCLHVMTRPPPQKQQLHLEASYHLISLLILKNYIITIATGKNIFGSN